VPQSESTENGLVCPFKRTREPLLTKMLVSVRGPMGYENNRILTLRRKADEGHGRRVLVIEHYLADGGTARS
jgi:hypothetical protein